VSSVLPGALAQALVTAILPHGLNLQVLGFLDGTVDEYHLPTRQEDRPHLGDTVLARVLYQVDSSSPRFAMSLAPHIVNMATRQYSASAAGPSSLAEAFPIGTVMDAVEIRRVETERGLIVEVAPGLEGFVHVSDSGHVVVVYLN
jgi:rRNA biogenesis protein RRP5